MKVYKPIILLCVAALFATSCKKDVDMTLVQKTVLENTDIRQIEVGDAWQVTIVSDSVTYVELAYSAYLDPYVKAKMEGNKLEIGFTTNVYPVINSEFRATVHISQLENDKVCPDCGGELDLNDAAQVQCRGDFAEQRIEVELSDASKCNGLVFSGESCMIKMEDASLMTGFQFVGTACNAELDDASQFNGEIQSAEQFNIELKSASRFVNKGGETATANIKLHDASILNMVETRVGTMHVELNSASEATVQVADFMDGTLKEASTLYYKGHPQLQVDCDESSTIHRI